MTTYQGERVSLDQGVPSIFSIGVSLGRIARFCGHLKQFYPVLGHVVVVAELCEAAYPGSGIYGLGHDTQESLFADVPTPMKSQVARNRERKVQQRIYQSNGLQWPVPEDIEEVVDEMDHVALVAEAIILQHAAGPEVWGTEVDPLAAKLTRRYANPKKIVNWLDADYAGKFFENTWAKYARLAGINTPDWS